MDNDIILTEEMKRAFDIIENTQDNIYITGKAGAGKSTFLKYLKEHSKKRFLISAPTGVAAVNVGGATLHSLFNIPFGFIAIDVDPAAKYNKYTEELMRNFDTLVIDEVSLLRPDVLDYIDRTLKMYRRSGLPFGGVQMVLIGDLFQLPPVVKKDEEDLMHLYYEGPYFFYACAWEDKGFHVCEFTHIFRQSDPVFIDMLNHIREYELSIEDANVLKSLKNEEIANDYNNGFVHLCAKKDKVAEINTAMLGAPEKTFIGSYEGKFSKDACPCDEILNIRIGARVMTLTNDSDKKYYNGSTGTVRSFTDDAVVVKLDSGDLVTITKYKWADVAYTMNDGQITQYERGTFTQFPLALAWAITIHKAQGLTFDKVAIHFNYAFAPGLLYVALSRCRSLEGLVSENYLSRRHILVDRCLKSFYTAVRKTGNYFDKNTIKYIV